MKKGVVKYLVIFFFVLPFNIFSQNIYLCNDGFIQFKSNAPQEFIKASSNALSGAINTKEKAFAFTLKISSFEGFNAALQRDHFNEKYLESDEFPEASFLGKIIEDIDFSKEGTYQVRAKGILKIHNVGQERIIKGTVKIGEGVISIKSEFSVILKDHNIQVPKVVHEKIASEILLEINADLRLPQKQ